MKRLCCLLLIFVLVAGAVSCAKEQAPEQVADGEQAEETAAPAGPPVGFVFPEETAYIRAFVEQVRPVVEAGGYSVAEYYSGSADGQVDDVYAAIGSGAQAIVIWPVDIDTFQEVLDESEAMHIPVVNLFEPINGVVRILVSPDYKYQGAEAAKAVETAVAGGARILTVEAQDLAVTTQMIHDGFSGYINEMDGMELASSVIVQPEGALEQVRQALAADEGINAVFVTDERLVAPAVEAVRGSGREIAVVAAGGSSEIMDLIGRGEIDASVFTSPAQLARLAGGFLLEVLAGTDDGGVQHILLGTEVITPENLAQYQGAGAYADTMKE